MLILVGIGGNNVYAFTSSDPIKDLGMPDITISPESGPIGSVITINISNFPTPPNGADQRLEFYMYLPAYDNYGNAFTKCVGYCILLYSFDDIKNGQIGPKEITFALPSVRNPDSYSTQLSIPHNESGGKEGAMVSSVCDVLINDEIAYRFGYSCNNYDTPVGEYQIDFGWAIGTTNTYDKRQTISFTVTDEFYQFKEISNDIIPPVDWIGGSSETIFKKFEQGEIAKTEFLVALKNQGWETDNDIRRALALVGELEHQKELVFVDETPKENTVPVVDETPKENTVPVVDNNSNIENQVQSSIKQTNSENIEDTFSSVMVVFAIVGVVSVVGVFVAFGRHLI